VVAVVDAQEAAVAVAELLTVISENSEVEQVLDLDMEVVSVVLQLHLMVVVMVELLLKLPTTVEAATEEEVMVEAMATPLEVEVASLGGKISLKDVGLNSFDSDIWNIGVGCIDQNS